MNNIILVSIIIGVILLSIIFLFVCRAHAKFRAVKQILKPLKTESGIKVFDLFLKNKRSEEFLDVQIAEGKTFSFYPKSKVITVEKECLSSNSLFDVAALSHEMGHATAMYNNSKWMSMWQALHVFENIFCWAILPLFLTGFVMSFFANLHDVATILMNFSTAITLVILLNRIINIPTEKEASKYGLKILENSQALSENELKMAKKMLQVALSTYVFAFYERLFVNFILAKKIFVKVFRIKPRKKHISKSAMQEQTEISNLVNTIKEDNNKFEAKTEFEKEQEKTQENGPQIDLNDPQIISMPHLDEEK